MLRVRSCARPASVEPARVTIETESAISALSFIGRYSLQRPWSRAVNDRYGSEFLFVGEGDRRSSGDREILFAARGSNFVRRENGQRRELFLDGLAEGPDSHRRVAV